MFTSRAEFRLSLRADNADQRLTGLAIELGCISEMRREVFEAKMRDLEYVRYVLEDQHFTPKDVQNAGLRISQDGNKRTAMQVLAFPDTKFEDVIPLDERLQSVRPEIRRQVEKDALYANYIARQERDVAVLKRDENLRIPEDFCFDTLDGLSNEMKSKLTATRPENLGQAARIDGITPAALTLILAHLRRGNRMKRA